MRKWKDVVSEEELLEYMEEEEETRSYCKKCLATGYEVFMGPKILMLGEKRQEDYENWKMCPKCYDVVPEYEMEQEAIVQDEVETSDSPFEQGKSVIESLPNRTGKRSKSRSNSRRRRNKYVLHEDEEINRELRQYGVGNVRIIK